MDLIHKIVCIIVDAGQKDRSKKFKWGEQIKYTPSEILDILQSHKEEILIFAKDEQQQDCVIEEDRD